MRTIGLGLALAATTQLVLLSSPALADDSKAPSTPGFEASTPPPSKSSSKETTGWVVLGVGGALALGGIVIDAVAAGKNQVSGQGASGDTSTTQNQKTDLIFAGTTMIVAGLCAGIYGGSMVLSARRSQSSVDAAAAAAPAVGSADAVTKTAQASLASSPSFLLPVLSARF